MQLVIAALAWWACAAACMWLSVHGGMVSLIWWPNGIAVAVLYILPRRKWLAFLAMATIAGTIDNWLFTMPPLRALGISVANFAEVAVVAALARHIMRGKHGRLLSIRTMASLFAAALAGGLVSTAIMALLTLDSMTLEGLVWWCASVTLGTLVATPLVLIAIERIMGGRKLFSQAPVNTLHLREIALAMAMVFCISLAVLLESRVQLLFLPMAATIFAAARYGHIGASVSVLAISVAGGTVSLGGQSPAAFLDFDRQSAAVLLQLYMMVLLATSVPLAALLMSNDGLAVRLRHRHARMRENLSWLGLAEETARIGRWRYNHKAQTRDWSRQMFLIYGLEPNYTGNPGDVCHLHPDGGKELFDLLDHHAQDKARYSFEYRIRTPKGEDRILKMHAMNEFGEDGERISTFCVVMDVTDHHQRQDLLDKERTRAMRLAAEAQYLAQTDPLTGLANRRRTMTQLEKCIEQCAAEDRPLALIAFDIDHFKQVNDTYGHQVGDDVLIRVAEIARGEVRASDLIGRTGGEEFVWLMPGALPGEAEVAADRLCHAIAENSGVNGLPPVTASIGFAVLRDEDTASSLLAKADAALYVAKGSGRNRVQKAA